jgi:uncharacterized Zn finger protein
MIVGKICKDCGFKTPHNRTVSRRDITYVCQNCGNIVESQYPRGIKDSDKPKYLKTLEMIV